MIRRFLDKLADNPPCRRAEIVSRLVQVYLAASLDDEGRAQALTAMTLVLDDPAPEVRRAMADALANRADAPRDIVIALANDRHDVAEPLLARSPVLGDGDLVDLVGGGDDRRRHAIARRAHVSIGLAAAIVAVSGVEPCHALITNPDALLTGSTLRCLVERHGRNGAIRQALLARNDLPLTLRHILIEGLSDSLEELIRERRWMEPDHAANLFRETREHAAVALLEAPGNHDPRPFAMHLADRGKLTSTVVIRAACAGCRDFLEEALSVLSGLPRQRVASLIQSGNRPAIDALYRRTGLPPTALPAFRAIVEAIRDFAGESAAVAGGPEPDDMVERVLTRYRGFDNDGIDEVRPLLGRLAAESRLARARRETGGYFRAA